MDTYQFTQNGILFEIERAPDRYGQFRVTAHLNRLSARGSLGSNIGGVYPRIDFEFNHDQWLHDRADHRGWILDDYETGEEAEARPTDTCSFDLSHDQVDAINRWAAIIPRSVMRPAPQLPPAPEYVEPIFGIGALNLGDGAEIQTPWPKYGKTCRRCGSSESDGAMFTTLGVTNICDDCA